MELTETPTEYTARYAKVVGSVQEAFVFVMSHMDKVGNDPQVIISPLHIHEHDEMGDAVEGGRMFEMSVAGMVELPEMA
ncbi:MAG TPA: hypothetical protein V6D20_20720 [Candidatus Obscuribacterales bacterium]